MRPGAHLIACKLEVHVHGQVVGEDVAERGGNTSMIHVDWMIGSDEIDIDGIVADGSKTPVFRKGEWA